MPTVLQRKNDIPFAIGFRCVKRGEVIRREKQDGSFKLLILTDDVRRVGGYHACDKDQLENLRCEVDIESKNVIHHKTLMSGGKMSEWLPTTNGVTVFRTSLPACGMAHDHGRK